MRLSSAFVTDGMGLALVLVLMVSCHLIRIPDTMEERLSRSILWVTASACTLEPFTFAVDGMPGLPGRILGYGLNLLLFMTPHAFLAVWCMLLCWFFWESPSVMRRLRTFLGPLFLANFVLVPVMVVLGQYFFLDGKNLYVRGPLLILDYAFLILELLVSVGLALACLFRKKSRLPLTILICLLPAVLGMGFQFVVYGYATAWVGTAISLMAVLLNRKKDVAFMDMMTRTYNRTYLGYVLEKADHKRCVMGGIMADLDRLKLINDRYGHAMGDDALRLVAEILRQAAPGRGIPVRLAGDEFLLLLWNGSETDCRRLMREMEEKTRKAAGERKYPFSFSMGFSLYVPGETTRDQFLREMDRNMYVSKKEHHRRDITADPS